MKKVLADGSIFSKQIARGISKYFSQVLFYGLREFNHPDIRLDVLVFGDHEKNLFLQESTIPSSTFQVTTRARFFYSMLSGNGIPEAGLFHSPYMFLPPKKKGRLNLLTVHDLINLETKFHVSSYLRKKFLTMAILRANQYICISQTTKQKLQESFPKINENLIHVIYQGIDDIFFETGKAQTTNDTIEKNFLLYVGQRDGYKNFRALLEFFKLSEWNSKVDIICVGGGRFTRHELALIASYGLSDKIKHAGFVTTLQLKHLYEKAFALMFTSLKEGFGLPIVEAMACGCPVICGDFSSMKEVSGSKTILMKDFSTRSFEEGLMKAAAFTSAQRKEGREHAKSFSWRETARQTFILYKKLLETN